MENQETEENEETAEQPDFAKVIKEQSETIKAQSEQINSLLEAVSAMTKAGANYQQGEKPEPKVNDNVEEVVDIHKDVKPLSELDFKI